MTAPPGKASLSLFLGIQSTPTSAVDKFSALHAAGSIPVGSETWRELIPTGMPGEGQQLAFEVDLDKCTGCKACVTACHSMNGLEEGETWRDIGMLVSPEADAAYQQTITTACHHCVDPGCLSGCPVVAYEKQEDTGVVKHLDDQCIGCQYCTWKCPFEVPKYNEHLGIVRKCDMCVDRLREGEAPACVQACPTQAIRIRIIDKKDAVERAAQQDFLPTAPDPRITTPTTTFVSTKPIPQRVVQSDRLIRGPKHAHAPLAAMLLITQTAIGLGWYAAWIGGTSEHILATISATLVQAGLAIGALHLGRPQYMFRAFLGWRTSWMSREVIAFTVHAGVSSTWAALLVLPVTVPYLALLMKPMLPLGTDVVALLQQAMLPFTSLIHPLGIATSITGLLSLISSVMIYHDTHKPSWNFTWVAPRFFGSALWAGAALGAVLSLWLDPAHTSFWLQAASIGGGFKLVTGLWEHLRNRNDAEWSMGPRIAMFRWALALVALLGTSPLALAAAPSGLVLIFGFLLLIGAEALERRAFFAYEMSARMPGAKP